MATPTPAQQAQLAGMKKTLEGLKTQVDAKVAAEKAKAPSQVGGGPQQSTRDLSIALARGTAVPKGTKKYTSNSTGGGTSVDVGGTIQSKPSATLDPVVKAMIDAQSSYDAQKAALTGEAGSPIAPTDTSGAGAPAGSNAVGALMAGGITTPGMQDAGASLYQKTKDFFGKFLDPNATFGSMGIGNTAHTTPSGTEGLGGSAGGGYGGGGGGSWGGGSGVPTISQGPIQGPVQPKPTDKPQANRAGVPDTGGASAGQNMSGLQTALQTLADTLRNFDVSSITGTSDPVDSAIQNMDDALSNAYTKALADLPDYEKMQKSAEKLYKLKLKTIGDREEMLADRYAQDKAAIEADYATQKEDKLLSQDKQTGQLAGGLAAAGAYLGFDNVNHSAMLSLEVTHDRELTVLGQAKIAALAEARRAFEDADFALLGEKINAIESYDNKITEISKTHFEQTLQMTQEARSNIKFMQDTETFERNKGFTNLDTIIEAGTIPTNNDIKQYAKTFGLAEEDVRGYITSKQNTKALEKTRAATADDLAILGVLKGIDKGTFVTIGGKTYEGINTPSAGSGGDDSSGRKATYKDAFEKFGNSDLARQLVDNEATIDDMYEFFGREEYPQEIRDYLAQDIPDLSTDQTIQEQQIQGTWKNISRTSLGMPRNADIAQMDKKTVDSAVLEINQRLIDNLGEDDARVLLVDIDDIYNDPNKYTKSYIDIMASNWETRSLKNKTSITKSVGGGIQALLDSLGATQGTVTTLNQ